MTRKERCIRASIICGHCIRNLAFYRSGWDNRKSKFEGQFLIRANGNFLDICVLEWCKLFGDQRAKHNWKKVVSDQRYFYSGLLQTLCITHSEFDNYIKKVRVYRDKFIAHLDDEHTMYPPFLDVILESTSFLYDYLRAREDKWNLFGMISNNASEIYQESFDEGKYWYNETAKIKYNI